MLHDDRASAQCRTPNVVFLTCILILALFTVGIDCMEIVKEVNHIYSWNTAITEVIGINIFFFFKLYNF